jgi:outer membrane receptor protein involved in Fe transport
MQAARLFIFFFAVLTLYVHAFGGTTGKIAGRVLDAKNNEALIGVNVFLEGTSYGATTDLEGYYIILNVAPGKYTMVVEYIGYQSRKLTGVSVSIDLTSRQDFELSEQTLELDEVIVVEGERPLLQKDITSSQSLVSSEEISVLPVTEVSDILQLQAGVTRGAGGEFHIRGGRSNEITYRVNGVSITDVYDNSAGIEIDNSSIQELQVISGTFNAEYGNAMSGIVNVVTKEGSKELHGSFMAYADDYLSSHNDIFTNIDDYNPVANYNIQGSLNGPIPLTGQKVTFFATARYDYSDGYFYGYDAYKPDGSKGDSSIVAMNWSKRYLGQLKLSFVPAPTLKINLEGLYSRRDYQDYAHDYKLNPDGNVFKYSTSANGTALLTHTLSAKTFYTVNASWFFRDFNEYLYENPLDSRYIHPDSLVQDVSLSFRTKGNNLHQFFRETQSWSGKFDLTSQISRTHLIKVGLEGNTHVLKLDDYNVTEDPITNTFPFVPATTDPSRNNFNRKPYDLAVYIQDKIELDEVIINIGLRWDYFDSNSDVLVDPSDPNINLPLRPGLDTLSLAEREPYFYKEAEPKSQISPRFGVAYPISASGVIHFSYGHFLQIPSFQYLFNNSDYKVPETGSGGIYGNPDLKPQKTVMYELGFKHEFSNLFLVDITGFYRDVRDWITTTIYSTKNLVAYSLYTNKDYSNVKGVTLTFKKRFSDFYAFDLSYTFQMADGSNSSPEDEYNSQRANSEPTLFLLPMDWDQRHLVNLSVNVGQETWGTTLLGRYGTGLPYTPAVTQYTSDRGISSTPQRNSRRRPQQFILDLNAYKMFKVAGYNIKAFLRVFNLLDTKTVVNVFADTGQPDYTTQYQNTPEDPRRPNSIDEYLTYPWHYGPPRQVQLGVEWMF